MDPLSTAVGAAIGSGISELTKQGMKFLSAVMGHPDEDLGTILGNRRREQRERAEKVLADAGLILLNLGLEPARIPDKILQPAIQAASLEEDEELQKRWANLLANAASGKNKDGIRVTFIAILEELTIRDATFVEKIYEMFNAHEVEYPKLGRLQLLQGYAEAGLLEGDYAGIDFTSVVPEEEVLQADDFFDFRETLDVLVRHGILKESLNVATANPVTVFSVTELGISFMRACCSPKAN